MGIEEIQFFAVEADLDGLPGMINPLRRGAHAQALLVGGEVEKNLVADRLHHVDGNRVRLGDRAILHRAGVVNVFRAHS